MAAGKAKPRRIILQYYCLYKPFIVLYPTFYVCVPNDTHDLRQPIQIFTPKNASHVRDRDSFTLDNKDTVI